MPTISDKVKSILGHKFIKLEQLRQKECDGWSLIVRNNSKKYLIDKQNYKQRLRDNKRSLADTYCKQMEEKKEKDSQWTSCGEIAMPILPTNSNQSQILNTNSSSQTLNQSQILSKSSGYIRDNDLLKSLMIKEKLKSIDKNRFESIDNKLKNEALRVKLERKKDKEFLKVIDNEIIKENQRSTEKKQRKLEYLQCVIKDAEIKKIANEKEKIQDIQLENNKNIEFINILDKQRMYRNEIKKSIQDSYNFDTEKFHRKVTLEEKLRKEYDDRRLDKLEVEYLER